MTRILSGALWLFFFGLAALVMGAGWGFTLLVVGSVTGKAPAVLIVLLLAGFIIGCFR